MANDEESVSSVVLGGAVGATTAVTTASTLVSAGVASGALPVTAGLTLATGGLALPVIIGVGAAIGAVRYSRSHPSVPALSLLRALGRGGN